jgi:hypothetical protein
MNNLEEGDSKQKRKSLCKECLRAEGQHFKHLLGPLDCNYFILNVVGLQVCSFVGKIIMCLAPSGAPVAVKHHGTGEQSKEIVSV